MKKKYIILILIVFFSFIYKVDATTGTVICTGGDTSPLNVRSTIGGTAVGGLACNSTVEVLEETAGNSSCSKWYKIKQGTLTGYSCGDYISVNKNTQTNLKGRVSCVENDDPLNVKNYVGGTTIDKLACDTEMTIIDKNGGSNQYCSNWYKVKYGNNKEGYVCGAYVITEVTVDNNDADVKKYRESLKSAGFPDSYLDDLVKLHIEHPSWVFTPYNTGLDWNTVIENEDVQSRNLVYYTYGEGYRSKKTYSYSYAKDEYYRDSREVNWWQASTEAIKYYMDPRNYLTSSNIFTFEALSYQKNYQTSTVVDKILGSSFMPGVYTKFNGGTYTTAFMDAAQTHNVSPVYLASRILQEQGKNGSATGLGGNFTYNNKTYSGIFNFYNIKTAGNDPTTGLVWAMGGADRTATSYGRPWNSPYKCIIGGAKFLGEDYISIGQNTRYFEKFAVSVSSGRYTHQYQQNITAPLTEGISAYNSYAGVSGLLDEPLMFIIPIYKNMPSTKVSAPVNKNVNSYLKNIKVNGTSLSGFSYDKLNYEMTINDNISSLNITAETINSKATVSGTGNKTLNAGKNEYNIVVKSEAGNTTTYKITVTKNVNEEEVTLSGVNTLKNITIDKINFNFSKDKLVYNLEVENNINKINISYEIDDNKATASGAKEVSLIEGTNKIEIKVTAEDKTVKTYTLNITRKGTSISTILNSSGVKYNNSYMYGIKINTGVSSLINNIKKVNSSATVTITDKNSKAKTSTFATGDKVTIKSGTETKSYEVVLYGDVNGDGKIDKLDYLAVLRHYYGYTKYSGVYKTAADVNRDGKIDKLDYLAVLRDYYGYKKISQ